MIDPVRRALSGCVMFVGLTLTTACADGSAAEKICSLHSQAVLARAESRDLGEPMPSALERTFLQEAVTAVERAAETKSADDQTIGVALRLFGYRARAYLAAGPTRVALNRGKLDQAAEKLC